MAYLGLSKLVKRVAIKSDGDVFHDLFRFTPHYISNISPTKIQSVNIHGGDWGTVSSIIIWNYTHDGKEKVAWERIEAIDEMRRSVTFEVIEGDLMELYNTCIFTFCVDTYGMNSLVTWTVEYEKLNEDVEDPTSILDLHCLDQGY